MPEKSSHQPFVIETHSLWLLISYRKILLRWLTYMQSTCFQNVQNNVLALRNMLFCVMIDYSPEKPFWRLFALLSCQWRMKYRLILLFTDLNRKTRWNENVNFESHVQKQNKILLQNTNFLCGNLLFLKFFFLQIIRKLLPILCVVRMEIVGVFKSMQIHYM